MFYEIVLEIAGKSSEGGMFFMELLHRVLFVFPKLL